MKKHIDVSYTKIASIVMLSTLPSIFSSSVFASECNNSPITGACVIEEGESVSDIKVEANGELYVHGKTSNSILTGEKTLNNNGNGPEFDDGTKYKGAYEFIQGGSAEGTIINAGGVQIVDNGTVDKSTVNYHGSLTVLDGTVTNSTVGSNSIDNGLKFDEAYINVIGENSTASDTVINNGGVLSASEGALVKNTTINAGGRLELAVNDDTSNVPHSHSSDSDNKIITTANDVIINKDGILSLDANTKATNVTVNQGGILWAENGAILDKVISSNSNLVANNATLNGTNVFNQHGVLTVGGSVSAEIIELYNSNIEFSNPKSDDNLSRSKSRSSNFTPANLKVSQLKGEGNNKIEMRIDATSGNHDTLTVTDDISGHFEVNLSSNGKEINTKALNSTFIEANNSKADTFTGSTDIGSYKYSLGQDGSEWKLQRSGNLSASASNAIMLANVTPTIWASELSVLRTRLGELHSNKENNGMWLKYLTARNRVNNNNINYKQDINGFVIGGDHQIDVSKGNLYIGGQFSYSYSSLNATESDGSVKSYSFGIYSTWLHDSGYYIDGVIKGNRFFSNNNAKFNEYKTSSNDVTNSVGFSVEVGKMINILDYRIEPYFQLAGFQGQKTDYTFNNGLNVKANSTRSLKGEVGTTIGKEFALSNGGTITPYIRLAVSQEFVKNNDITINDSEKFTNNMYGLTGKYGIGLTTKIIDNLDAYGEFNYAKGNKLETPYSGTLGVRYSF